REGMASFRCDLDFLDSDGQVLARNEEVALKTWHREPSARFYSLAWDQGPPGSPPLEAVDRGVALVLGDADGPRGALARRLTAGGFEVHERLSPRGADGAGVLVQEWLRSTPACAANRRRIVSVEPTVESLFELARALGRSRVYELEDFAIVSPGEAAAAFHQSLGHEETTWRCRAVGVGGEALASDAGLDTVARELLAPRENFRVRVDALGRRHLPRLVPCSPPLGEVPLKDEGAYWIIGGAGGLGREVARLLASGYGARLLITGRRAELDPSIHKELEALGGTVLYVSADVTDPTALAGARDLALETFGALDGVVHAAGVLDDGAVSSYSRERLDRLLAAKAEGGRVLADLLAGRSLDFVALFSSLTAVFGSPGQAAYAAANGSLDDLVRTGAFEARRVVSIAWGPWREVGMVADPGYVSRMRRLGFEPFRPDDGARAFVRALGAGAPRLVVVGVGAEQEGELRSRFNRLPEQGSGATPGRAAPQSGAVDPSSEVVASALDADGRKIPVGAFLRRELARKLGRAEEAIDPATPFHRIGVDSLLAVGLVKSVERAYGLRLYPTLLFEHETLEQVSRYLEGELRRGGMAE
ncbi:MAG: SDR family NAD(P)-dependent oxidoreductase, partial [Planctomycetota bacterium]